MEARMGEEARNKLATANCCFRQINKCTRTSGEKPFCDMTPRPYHSSQKSRPGTSGLTFSDRKRDREAEAAEEQSLRQQASRKQIMAGLCDDYIKGQARPPTCNRHALVVIAPNVRTHECTVPDCKLRERRPPRPELHSLHRMLLNTRSAVPTAPMLLREPRVHLTAGGPHGRDNDETRGQLARCRILSREELDPESRGGNGMRERQHGIPGKKAETRCSHVLCVAFLYGGYAPRGGEIA